MSTELDRRSFMSYFAAVGLTSTLFPGVLWAKLAAGAEITVDTIASAEEVAAAFTAVRLQGLNLGRHPSSPSDLPR